jgi:trk system potassium uptake protein TrkA
MTEQKIAVIGVGDFGSAIAKILSERGAEVFAIDSNESLINDIQDEVSLAVRLDATDKKALQTQNITDFDAVVVAIGENFEALLLCCVQLQELGVNRIIARARGIQQKQILRKIGIEEILTPEYEFAKSIAEKLLNPSILSFLELPDGYEIAELRAPKGVDGRTLEDIGLRNKYKLNLITVKREYEVEKNGEEAIEQHILGVPTSDTVIYKTDTLVVFGSAKDIEKFIELN